MNNNYEVIYQDFVLIFIFKVREYSLTRNISRLGIARVRAYMDIEGRCYEEINKKTNGTYRIHGRNVDCRGKDQVE
jgi:hypothetical protein